MFCPKCGNDLAQNAKFCTKCGNNINNDSQQLDQNTQYTQPNSGQSYISNQTPNQTNNTSKNNKTVPIIIITILSLLVVAGLITAICLWYNSKNTNTPLHVGITINADGYNKSNSSRFPINIKGETKEGDKVDQLLFINEDSGPLDLYEGKYTFDFPASPLNANGTFWDTPNKLNVEIEKKDRSDANESITLEKPISYSKANIGSVEKDKIDTAKEYAKKDSECSSKADSYYEKTIEAKNAAKAADEKAGKTTKLQEYRTRANALYNECLSLTSSITSAGTGRGVQHQSLQKYEAFANEIISWASKYYNQNVISQISDLAPKEKYSDTWKYRSQYIKEYEVNSTRGIIQIYNNCILDMISILETNA